MSVRVFRSAWHGFSMETDKNDNELEIGGVKYETRLIIGEIRFPVPIAGNYY